MRHVATPLLTVLTFVCIGCPLLAVDNEVGLVQNSPDLGGTDRIHGKYMLRHNGMTRQATWTFEYLSAKVLKQNVPRKDAFRPDKTFGEEFRAEVKDYLKSGYDRGHLAPSANHRMTLNDQRATFVLSNMSPQLGDFNRGVWKMLEAHVRKMASKPGVEIYCVTAPLWLADKTGTITIKTIGPNKVWVPTHCGKAMLIKEKGKSVRLIAWILPNAKSDKKTFESFRVTTDEFERAAGIDVWAFALEDEQEKKLEATK